MIGSSIYCCPYTWVFLLLVTSSCLAFPDHSPYLAGLYDNILEVVRETCGIIIGRMPESLGNYIDSERLCFALCSVIFLEVTFWTLNGALLVIMKYDLLKTYKVHDGMPDEEMVFEAFLDAVIGHFIIRPPLLYAAYPLFASEGWMSGSNLPSLPTFLLQIFICLCVDDTVFYWTHRGLHHPKIYKHIHKKHHTFKKPVCIATEYAHPVEDFISNTLSTVLGPLILQSHSTVFWYYTCLKLAQSIEAHSGYNPPFPISIFSLLDACDCAPAHDFHHSHNTGNFGGFFIFWDWVCGTDGRYNKFLETKKSEPAYHNVTRHLKTKQKNKTA